MKPAATADAQSFKAYRERLKARLDGVKPTTAEGASSVSSAVSTLLDPSSLSVAQMAPTESVGELYEIVGERLRKGVLT